MVSYVYAEAEGEGARTPLKLVVAEDIAASSGGGGGTRLDTLAAELVRIATYQLETVAVALQVPSTRVCSANCGARVCILSPAQHHGMAEM